MNENSSNSAIDQQQQQTAVVRSLASEPHLTIELTLAGKARFMARPKDEPLEKCLARMARSAAPPPRRGNGGGAKKKKGGGGSGDEGGSGGAERAPLPPAPLPAPLTAEQIIAATALFPPRSSSSSSSSSAPDDLPPAIPGETPNGVAWPMAAGGTLRIGNGDGNGNGDIGGGSPSLFRVVVNPPTVIRASLSAAAPLTGSPLCPAVDAVFADARMARYRWFKKTTKETKKNDGGGGGDGGWEAIEGATGAAYVPSEEDVGALLRVVVTPAAARANGAKGGEGRRRGDGGTSSSGGGGGSDNDNIVFGASVSADSAVPVSRGPALPPWHGRVAEDASSKRRNGNDSKNSSNGNAPFSTPRFPIPASNRNDDKSNKTNCQQQQQQPRLRVLTYNLLADQYAASDFAKAHLFAHCHPRFLDADYRRSLGAAEVARYGADVVCLQEVDERCFSDVLLPLLSAEGYEGRFTGKASTVREGSATFWRRERFECVAQRDVVLKEVFAKLWRGGSGGGGGGERENDESDENENDPMSARAVAGRHSALLPTLRSSEWLRDSLSKVSTVAQVTLLVPKGWRGKGKRKKEEEEGESALASASEENEHENENENDETTVVANEADGPLLVTNTHLFFHPSAPHIRTLHVAAMLTEAADVAERARREGLLLNKPTSSSSSPSSYEAPAPIFCGDLNSDLNDGVPGAIELLREGHLPGGYWDWALGASFRYDDDGVGPPATEASPAAAAPSSSGPLPKPFSAAATSSPPATDGLCPSDLSLPFDFSPADSLRTPCTNHVRGYSGLLDFVWADRGAMRALTAATSSGSVDAENGDENGDADADGDFLSPPPPPVSSLGGFIPNERFPSDHLAVIADLEWLPREDGRRNPGRPPPPADAAGRGPTPPWPPPLPPQAALGGSEAAVLALPEVRIREEMREMNEKKKMMINDGNSSPSPSLAAVEGKGTAAGVLSPPPSASSAAASVVLSGKGHTVSASDPSALPACVLALRAGQILAVPTDTLYGIAACACSPSAVAKVYAAKGRGGSAPLAVCVAAPEDVAGVADVSGLPRGLLEAMLPGPVTLLLKRRRKWKRSHDDDDDDDEGGGGGGENSLSNPPPPLPTRLCAALNPATPTVGVRVPDSQFVRSLALVHGGPIALTSANESGRPPALEASECYEGSSSNNGNGNGNGNNGIAGECAAVVDGGRIPASGREGSTIVDLSSVDVREQEKDDENSNVGRSFSIVREGQAAGKVRELLVGFGLVEMV